MTQRLVHSQCKDLQLDKVSKELMRQAMQCVTTKGEFYLVMSESDSLDDFYALLMCDPEMRAMPWEKTHVYFFGNPTPEDSIQRAISAHSGTPESQVHTVCDGIPEGITIDCCISSGDDLEGLPDEFARNCASWLIVATSESPSLHLGGVTHIFVVNES